MLSRNLSYRSLNKVGCFDFHGSRELKHAMLQHIRIPGHYLACTNFSFSDLQYADMSCCLLTASDFRYANLRYVNLRATTTRFADFLNADMLGVCLEDAELHR